MVKNDKNGRVLLLEILLHNKKYLAIMNSWVNKELKENSFSLSCCNTESKLTELCNFIKQIHLIKFRLSRTEHMRGHGALQKH